MNEVVKPLSELKVGDWIKDDEGNPVQVTTIHQEHIPEDMWEIEDENGEILKVSGNHLWYCETKLDWELHSSRLKESKKALRNVTKESLALLEETILKEESVETTLIDLITLLEASDNTELQKVLERTAESIGHISEEKTTLDALDSTEELEGVVRYYDARLFAEQILGLTGLRKYKNNRIIVGSVMTTNQMLELSEIAEIPVTTPK